MTFSDERLNGDEVRAFLSDDETPSEAAIAGVERITRVPGRLGEVILLPDIDQKSNNPFPTGLAVAFDGRVVPSAIGASINCGTTFARLDISADDVSPERWQVLLQAIDARVREYDAETRSMSRERVLQSAVDPLLICTEAGYSDDETARVEAVGYQLCDGVTGEQVREALPDFSLRAAELSMGQLGSGNHFIEFHSVGDGARPEMSQLGMEAGDLTLALHSSPPLGPLVSLMFSARKELRGVPALKMLVRKVLFHVRLPGGVSGLLGAIVHTRALKAQSPIGRAFRAAYDAAAASGYAHRAMLMGELRELVSDHLGASIEVVCDLSHNGIWRERIADTEAFVHRHGACSFRPGEYFADDHPFAVTGQPVFVGSSMHTPSGLFVPGPNASETHYSISHGTGRSHPHRTLGKAELAERLQAAGVEAWWSGHGPEPPRQYPQYRTLTQVAEVVEDTGAGRLVGRLMPRAVYKIA
jgi:tRNA-splicing ligase RtcB (3'-phosphate/5'-hydroxy nucleic acid ligase)